MTASLRDLGYKPYAGPRHPPSHNTWVLLRYGVRRAWAGWLVKLALLSALGPGLLKLGVWVMASWIVKQNPGQGRLPDPAVYVRDLCGWQLWLFASAIALGAGSTAIAEDVARRALPFYFSKPVTPAQYVLGRAGAVAVLCFAVIFLPALALTGTLAGLAEEPTFARTLGLGLPAFGYAAAAAVAVASVSVGISSLSSSRALTASSFALAWLLPHTLAAIVDMAAHWPWLYLFSLPELLSVLGDALFRRPDPGGALRWFHALPSLLAFGGIAWWRAIHRLTKLDVIP